MDNWWLFFSLFREKKIFSPWRKSVKNVEVSWSPPTNVFSSFREPTNGVSDFYVLRSKLIDRIHRKKEKHFKQPTDILQRKKFTIMQSVSQDPYEVANLDLIHTWSIKNRQKVFEKKSRSIYYVLNLPSNCPIVIVEDILLGFFRLKSPFSLTLSWPHELPGYRGHIQTANTMKLGFCHVWKNFGLVLVLLDVCLSHKEIDLGGAVLFAGVFKWFLNEICTKMSNPKTTKCLGKYLKIFEKYQALRLDSWK